MMSRLVSTRWAQVAAILLMAVVVGVAIALASSLASITQNHRALGTPAPVVSSPSPSPATPPVSVTQTGILGNSPYLVAASSSSLFGLGPNVAAASADSGKTWVTMTPPGNGSGIVIDPASPMRGVTGGSSIRFTVDGGLTWKPALFPPPGKGPYQPIEVSPFDGGVWFFVHTGRLLRTRDASQTWRDLSGLPALTAPILAAGPTFGQFYLASGATVFELIDNGQQVIAQPSLPGGGTVVELAAGGGDQGLLFARTSDKALHVLNAGRWLPVTGAFGGPIGAGANGVLVVGNGGEKLGSPGAALYSVDSGTTWNAGSGLPYDQTVEAIAGQPASTTFYAYCYGGDIYSSTNGGRDWILFSHGLRSKRG